MEDQFDLKPQPLKRPMDRAAMGGDVAALNSLLGLLNNPEITGAQVPKGEIVTAPVDRKGATVVASDPAVLQQNGTKVTPAPIRVGNPGNTSKIFYTGLIGSGKDYCAEQTGAKIFGFADPLYHLAEYFFGVTVNAKEGKTLPGIRAFLQAAGQWGRGEVTEQHPLTPARACFVSMIRSLGDARRFDSKYEVQWSTYGKSADIWLDACNRRVEEFQFGNRESRVAITNVRFKNEYARMGELGWTHFHVMCSAETRLKRVPGASAKDVSEGLALALNNDVTKRISTQPRGAKLRVIWNDSTPPPSPRLYTVPEFLSEVSTAQSLDDSSVMTGE